jgi:acyl carrier protein
MSTKETVRTFIVSELAREEGAELGDSDQLIEAGIIDSMGIISLLGFLETEFTIQIDSDELLPENLGTVQAISDLVDRKLGARGA